MGTDDWDQAVESNNQNDDEIYSIKRTRGGYGCRIWLLILSLVPLFFACGIAIIFISGIAEGTWFVPGDPANFDPLEVFEEVQNHAGEDVRFLGMQMKFIRPDGTLDLHASYNPSVEYVFVRSADKRQKMFPLVRPVRVSMHNNMNMWRSKSIVHFV